MSRLQFFLLAGVLIVSGCAHTISPELLERADQQLSYAELRRNPEDHQGKIVVLGGVIVQAHIKNDGTLLEVYQTDTDPQGKPVNLDLSEGRFLVFHNQLLDPEIYRQGRMVTLAGRVEGKRRGKVGQVFYDYPYLTALEIRLWAERTVTRYEPYPGYLWDPWDPLVLSLSIPPVPVTSLVAVSDNLIMPTWRGQ